MKGTMSRYFVPQLLLLMLSLVSSSGCIDVLLIAWGNRDQYVYAEHAEARGIDYNLRALQTQRNADKLDQHVLALQWLHDRKAVEPLLRLQEQLETGEMNGIFSSDEISDILGEIGTTLCDLTGTDTSLVDEETRASWKKWIKEHHIPYGGTIPVWQWKQWLYDRASNPPVSYGYMVTRYVGDPHVKGSKTSTETVLSLWKEWWYGNISTPWDPWFAEQIWRLNGDDTYLYVRWTPDYFFSIDRNAQLCRIPVKTWDKMSWFRKHGAVSRHLNAKGFSRSQWDTLLQDEKTGGEKADKAKEKIENTVKSAG